MQNVKIRRIEKKDIPQLIPVMYEYIVDFYKRPRPSESDLRELVNHLLATPSVGLQFVAEENDRLIGFSTLYFTFSTTMVKKIAILNDLYVIPEAREKKDRRNAVSNQLIIY